MLGTPYPNKQMHRIAYTKLTAEQIAAKLGPVAERGPQSVSPLATDFAGESMRIVTDDGPTLSYKFASDARLSVAENGGNPVDAGFGALEIDHICLFTHMVPGTQRGYTVVTDRHSKLATVIELWFSGYEDNREVQRQIYYGYVEAGGEAPKKRHELSDRMEGRGYHWRQDTGMETLEYYPSAGYSHFVELSRTGGELGFCAPSDYVKLDNDFFVYTRTECEFSGTFTAYVVDMNRTQQIGVRLGFDEHDNLHYYLFRGHGDIVGQIARFEKFGDYSGDPIPGPKGKDGKPVKGGRRVYRPIKTMEKLTREQVAKVVEEHSTAFPARVTTGGAAGMATNALSANDFLTGKVFTLRYDSGPVMDYKVDSADELAWRRDGEGDWTKARYHAYEVAPGLFLFGHLLAGAPNHDGHIIAVDFHQGLATCYNGFLNTPYFANEAGARTLFGVLEMQGIQPPMYRRHARTTEMLGRCITYSYAPGLTSMHLYSTPNTVSWIIFTPDGHGGMEWSGPGDFVKIRDGIYFMYWLEEACNGTLGTVLLNLNIMHDAGIGYFCGSRGLNMSQIGAVVRHAGKFEVDKYFQIKT
ncbi:MAG TPA: MoaF N-terminal domain-containing protein [Steroidobacteraceae bacterium]|nr:MoaF N-terminal domain-containing protein [Steroidobacteraceae bacterium]